ncbi:alpha/beta fold hydrolase [Saccharicrinis sp. GN24d3]|uniref:alpha/beta fold hydrolase n=1 Tax=Saccharicrinis sp. GN24d3 TaxID=3458416 RepID=UPI004036A2BB
MRNQILMVLLFLSFLCSVSCHPTEKNNTLIDGELFVEVPESKLYIRMRGNPEKPLIINLHGGPGGYSGIDIKLMGPALEDNFLIAYLDQRGCGKSPACDDISMLTISQYVEDLDIVIDSLRNRYDKKKVALMGTSWGGMYGFLYLLKNSKKVNAYACIDGKVNSKYQNDFLLDFQVKKVNDLLQGQISEERKTELEEIAQELKRIKQRNYDNFYEDVNWMLHEVSPKLGFNAYFADTSKIISMDAVLNDTSLLQLMNYSKEEYLKIGEKAEFVNQAFLDGPEYNDINIENELATLKTPCAVIQGEFDYVVGLGHAELIYNALSGLSDENKELHILPNTGHCPAIECPESLADILIKFFEKHTL